MKFTFKTETFGFGSPRTTYEFDCDQIEDVLYHFKKFLRGAGYEIGINEDIELVDRSWEFNSEMNNMDHQYNHDDIVIDPFVAGGGTYDFDDSQVYVDSWYNQEPEPKTKKGKK